ncbi:hypothetical protein JX266_010042 [Neoarthrinium moseri]|uniref:uncharacterized protein n=1 Tax=Neoarthrinium moseri TaxID=1658444 RepID=UPI001FDBBE07|nr:uncharacterized protein JN550_004652 [Neoarthrinium moseri]KAI1843783.1 hypothetical protein JX266_010042 [Neoarthrinium moseri]KAI1871207.1 hypothetical protein JN550_004652 [Neoarthrinium moseri]
MPPSSASGSGPRLRSDLVAQEHRRLGSGEREKAEATPLPGLQSTSRIALKNIDSPWFLIPQGTGVLAIVLWQLPYQFRGLHTISIVFWGMTIIQFFTILFFNTEVACLASIVVTFTAIVQMLALLLGEHGWEFAVYALWWVCAVLSLLMVIGVPYVFANIRPPSIARLLPNVQLPLVTAMTTATAGSALCQATPLSPKLQVPLILVSYLLIGLAVPLASILDTLFLGRLYNETKDDKANRGKSEALNLAYQSLVLVGPWGQCSSALQGLGQAVLSGSFSHYNTGIILTSQAAPAIGYLSLFGGIIFWGHATFWWAFTIISVAQAAFGYGRAQHKAGFDLAAWSMVFPWGVYTSAAEDLGRNLDSSAFRVWATVLAVLMVVIWILNTAYTIKGCVAGTLLGLENGWRRPQQDEIS